VKSTPTIVINEGLTLVGQVSTEELAGRLMEVGKADSLTPILDSMIQSGRADDAAALICRETQPEALLPLYLSKEFSTRMGALVVMEEALALNPRALDPIVGQLTDILFQDDAPLRGDTAELLGKMGNPAAIPALRSAAEDEDPDVREAALEALELLEK
ncbi:MAG: HEAT repeat domain-containing protein, partial [Deltaproteobacteria bacterium]|nr:HEAT repeat domain-containing protein [Deltaproteobacteria bacterium]